MSGSSSSGSAAAAALLRRQLKHMQSDKDIPGISCGLVNDNNIFEWEVMLMISDDCKYYGGASFYPVPVPLPLSKLARSCHAMLTSPSSQEATSAPRCSSRPTTP